MTGHRGPTRVRARLSPRRTSARRSHSGASRPSCRRGFALPATNPLQGMSLVSYQRPRHGRATYERLSTAPEATESRRGDGCPTLLPRTDSAEGDAVASEVELLEVFRLGEAAGEADIVREVGDQLADHWMGVSRFREVQALTSRSLRVQSSPSTVLAGRAYDMTGNLTAALEHFEQALPIYRRSRPGARSHHPEQHRRGAPPAGGRAAGAGLLRAGAAHPPGGRGPGR